jgi:plastocyanin
MRSFGTIILLLTITLSFFTVSNLSSQNNVLKGKLTLTTKSKKQRVSRGNTYRNRVKGDVLTDELQLNESEFSDVIISLRPSNFTPEIHPTKNAKVFQKNKAFSPKLIAVTVGSTVQFVNQDDFYHNVFSLTPKTRFNIGRRPAGSSNGAKIKKIGAVKVFCDIHPQMKATIISLDTPYFVKASEDGKYSIANLPNGKYQIEIYISEYKSTFQTIELKNGQTVVQDLILDQERVAFIENKTSRLIAISTCCDSGVSCKSTTP